MFNLDISAVTMSGLTWFMIVTFHVEMEVISLQHQTFLLPLDTSAAG